MNYTEVEVVESLKSIARNPHIKSYIQQSNELYPLLWKAAKRFVSGEKRENGIEVAKELIARGYLISLEYIGENITDIVECQKATKEFLTLIEEMGSLSIKQTISLDLSHIGLSVNKAVAYQHLCEIAKKAKIYEMNLMISMEESSKTDAILDIYKKTTRDHSNVGITIQVHLHRSNDDIQDLMHYPGKIRLVKGAYQESGEVAIPRSMDLNQRYMDFTKQLIDANHPVSIATHDETLIHEMEKGQLLLRPNVEIEMLYGIRPDLIKNLNDKGYKCKVYLIYGTEWYLYLCHRIAECPENIFQVITDIVRPSLNKRSRSY